MGYGLGIFPKYIVDKWQSIEWTEKKVSKVFIIAFLITVVTIFLIPNSLFIDTPIKVTRAGYVYGSSFENCPTPPVNYRYIITFESEGCFSVNNPVNVKVTIRDSNFQKLLDYYDRATFTHGYSVPIQYNPDGSPRNAMIYLSDNGDGTYSGEGTIVWYIEEPTWIVVLPTGYNNVWIPLENYTKSGITPQLTVSGAADTLSLRFTESAVKLTLLLGSFSILVLEPLFVNILVKTKKKGNNNCAEAC